MNVLQKEYKNKCVLHSDQSILFINTQQNLENNQSIYLCDECLSEDINFSPTEIISIKQIIENGEKQIIQKWPPVNNYQIIKDLMQRMKETENNHSISSQIISFFSQLKDEISKQIDFYQKKITNQISDHEQIIEQYQKISKIKQFRNILIESIQNQSTKVEDLKKFIAEFQQNKETNSVLLAEVLKRQSQFEDQFKLENLNWFKEQILSNIKKFDVLCADYRQETNQNSINLKNNDNNNNNSLIKQLMKLISNKTNFCSNKFLEEIKEQFNKFEPFFNQIKLDLISEKKPIQFELLDEKQIDLIDKQVNHLIKLKINQEYYEEIANSQEVRLLFKKNCSSKISEFDKQFQKYLVETLPFAINHIDYYLNQQQIEYCFSEELKPPNLTLKSKTILINDSSNSVNRFGLINPSLDVTKIVRIQFKVLQLKTWIGLGICFVKTILNLDYKFQYNTLGNGYYLISSNGYSWSNSRQDQHNNNNSFSFSTNHQICLEFNPLEKKLKFYNQFNKTKFQMDIEIPENDEVVFCVNLCNTGNEIEIVNHSEVLDSINFD